MPKFSRSHPSSRDTYDGSRHRYEHWYRDNSIYFITARCRDKFPAFTSDEAKAIFWDRFTHYTTKYGFRPHVASLLNNHYHFSGHLEVGANLAPLMRQLHGSVAKLTNDLLDVRLVPFWCDKRGHDYFDGCLRDEKQYRRTYGYVLRQSIRHGLCDDWREYPHTKVYVAMENGLAFALSRRAFLPLVPYQRYQRKSQRH